MPRPPRDYRVFHHVAAEKREAYRSVLACFFKAKQRFAMSLRPVDVVRETEFGADELTPLLEQLCDWGNLERFRDTSEVTTVDEFYEARWIYQLTAAGEAAQRALEQFDRDVAQPGELKTAALDDIHAHLEELARLGSELTLDAGKIHRCFKSLEARFDELTQQAQRFLSGLQRAVDLHEVDIDAFVAYKQTLIDYLQRFIGELLRATSRIANATRTVESLDLERLFQVTAERELSDRLTFDDQDLEGTVGAWRQRWRGLVSWFVAPPAQRSHAELLRAKARASIPALLVALATIHDRRQSRSDRSSDLIALADWFSDCESTADAHRLYRAAFGLTPARHLRIDRQSMDDREASPVSAQTPWGDAPPLRIAPRLRQSGRIHRPGRPATIIDTSKEKDFIKRQTREQIERLVRAQDRLATGERLRLSELPKLDRFEFEFLRTLLSEGRKSRHHGGPIAIASTAGTLFLTMASTGDGHIARIETDDGVLSGPDQFLWLERQRVDRRGSR